MHEKQNHGMIKMDHAEHWFKNTGNAEQVNFFYLVEKMEFGFFSALKTRLTSLHMMQDLCFWLIEKMENSKKQN